MKLRIDFFDIDHRYRLGDKSNILHNDLEKALDLFRIPDGSCLEVSTENPADIEESIDDWIYCHKIEEDSNFWNGIPCYKAVSGENNRTHKFHICEISLLKYFGVIPSEFWVKII